MAPTTTQNMTAVSQLAMLVSERPHEFLRPTIAIQQTAIEAAKALLDPLATNIAHAQTVRRNEIQKKRKRGDDENQQPILQVRQVYTKGFGVRQIWEQARRILEAAQQEIDDKIQLHTERLQSNTSQNQKSVGQTNGKATSGESDLHTSDDDLNDEPSHSSDDDLDDEAMEGVDDLEDKEDVESEEDIEADSDTADSSDGGNTSRRDTYVQDPNHLNDGFFSIDEFNRQSQFLEQMDARGEDDNPSDEDEIDWDADPLAQASTILGAGKSNEDVDDDSDSEGGPTFGDADLDASEDDDEDLLDGDDQDLETGMGGLSNANEIRYADFFEPPSKKPSKTKRMRALPKTQPPQDTKDDAGGGSDAEQQRLQNDLKRAMADVRRDLLDSDEDDFDEDEDEDEEGLSGEDRVSRRTKQTDKNMSTHEKQRAEIAAEIRRLEAANVAKRDWQLSGEARAADRPVNSLIEEDLEFERAGKPVAPVTAETSEEIDALIKRRILAREFDEVVRRVPGSLNLANETRRGRVELDDNKPQASLGEIYEAEHQKNADPLAYIDKRSAAVKKQHAEIEILWKQVREQLDVLSNMHFKPKRADIQIKAVEDRPRIAMEDARPVGEIESGEGGMLAPQEVYRPGVDSKRNRDEIVLQGGAAVAREEMSREEKLRRRRREKERSKKAQDNKPVNVLGKGQSKVKGERKEKETEKANIIEDLKRGGVKVVGKEGQLQNIGKGKKSRGEGAEVIGSNLKL